MLRPISHIQWTPNHLSHLLNRAGFGKAPHSSQNNSNSPSLKAHPAAWVNRLLDVPQKTPPEQNPEWAQKDGPTREDFKNLRQLPEEERRKKFREIQRINRQQLILLQSWWLDRMLKCAEPLQEKMTLFWHGHFVSSRDKVKRADLLWQQNALLRDHGMGSFRDLTIAIGRDPAMLIYLDGAKSKRSSPNENYARELMELFTLGEGHYTESDIKQAARAFTGWICPRFSTQARFIERRFDSSSKTFFGKSGNFNDKDIVNIIFSKEQVSLYLCKKLWEYFAYVNPEKEIVQELASTLRKSDFQIKPVLKELFLSQAFYSKKAMRTQIKSPVMWLASLSRLLDMDPFPSTLGVKILTQLGQELFNPPSVKGWDGGRSWISTSTLILRNNIAHLLINGGNPSRIGLNTQRGRNLPDQITDTMTEEQKSRIRKMRQRQSFHTIPSLLQNQNLTSRWQSTPEKDRFSLLIREVFQGPVSPTTYRELESDPQLILSASDTRKALQTNLSKFVAHPEFQLT